MFSLGESSVQRWRNESGTYLPIAIAMRCPGCSQLLTYANLVWTPEQHETRISLNRCPVCRHAATFYLVGHQGKTGGLSPAAQLYSREEPPGRQPLAAIVDNAEIVEPIQRAYLSAVNVFSSGEWSGTAVLTRKLLEGITKVSVPQHASLPLAAQVKKLAEGKDLSAPITTLADAIRKGGNLGAHFDLEASPDQNVARLMLDLVEELMEYFYVLPGRIKTLHDEIEKLGTPKTADEEQ